MALQVIIIRADGALAEIEDIRRKAFAQAFAESGFDWACDREGFALTAKLIDAEARMAHYVRSMLRGRPETEDFAVLMRTMYRRASKVFSELLASAAVDPRPGIRDLVVVARQEGIRLALASLLNRCDTDRLVRSAFGEFGRNAFDVVVTNDTGGNDACARVYREMRDAVGTEPDNCLLIEAASFSAEAGKAAGFPVITTRCAHCRDTPALSSGSCIVADIASLIARPDRDRLDPMTSEDRADLMAAVYRLHARKAEGPADADWSEDMRVADILKSKGGASVKAIAADATVQALARSFRMEDVGAMLVLDSEGRLQGIVSERDLARGIDQFGIELPAKHVSDLMTRAVVTCAPGDRVSVVANVMTERRFRHLPVVVNGKVVGIVSIGDVLKSRVDEIQLEASVLRDVARARR
ncbi:signal transduction protein [Hyphomicrobium methylovorum]|uniref:CBS domain-containing protein n=1 Tax=Hyphomicrobium methylovorum TaxID=84 RepID=UPI0015E65164|nr:CBS domain-containing protein [Hyphomicrobium methylovorum]MBA2125967.1 signal transduction protein [Hyphomicrobium methylovorum]